MQQEFQLYTYSQTMYRKILSRFKNEFRYHCQLVGLPIIIGPYYTITDKSTWVYWMVLGEARGWLFIECIWIEGLWDCKFIEFGLCGPFIGLCGVFGKTCGPWLILWPFIGLISIWFGASSWFDSPVAVGWANEFILNELDVAQFCAENVLQSFFHCITNCVTKMTQNWQDNDKLTWDRLL